VKKLRSLIVVCIFVSLISVANTRRALGADAAAATEIPANKQTTLGLYVTAKEAYQRWQADPRGVKIIDVRTPEEYIFVGHPEMAWNVPLKFIEYRLDADTKKPVMRTNPKFLEQVKQIAAPDEVVLVTCRSGQRSGPAVNLLAEAGYRKAYTVVDGVEGDKVNDPTSAAHGQRLKNGWKNAGIPWTYSLDPKLVYVEKAE
jgi:rhodanese-related sulfurtransferase